MLKNYGGLVLSDDGSRKYPGSGGYIGGFSIDPAANYSKLGGAGDVYSSFTPSGAQNSIPGPDDWPNQDCRYRGDCPNDPPYDPGPVPTTTTTTPTTTTTTPTTTTTTGPNWEKYFQILRDLSSPGPRTSVNIRPAQNVFTPGQNYSGGSFNMLWVLIAVVVGFFVWKRYKGK